VVVLCLISFPIGLGVCATFGGKIFIIVLQQSLVATTLLRRQCRDAAISFSLPIRHQFDRHTHTHILLWYCEAVVCAQTRFHLD